MARASYTRARKGVLTGMLDGGVHWHAVAEGRARTVIGGEHRHAYLIDGQLVYTEEDGGHDHSAEDWGAWYGGEHKHRLVLPSGEEVETEINGYHRHGEQVETTAIDGEHVHAITLPDGATTSSLTIHELISQTSLTGELFLRAGKSDVLVEMRLGDEAWAAQVDRGAPGDMTEDVARELAQAWCPDGGSFRPIDGASVAPVAGRPADGEQDLDGRWCIKIADVDVDRGMASEVFVASGPLAGRLAFGGAYVDRSTTPDVLKFEDVPEVAALPRAMIDQVPADLRWWGISDPEIRKARRDRLVELRHFDPSCVDVTDRGLAKVHVERAVFEWLPDRRPLSLLIEEVLPEGRDVVSPLEKADWRTETSLAARDQVLFFDLDSDDVEEAARAVAASDASFLAVAPDSPEARACLGKLGYLTKFADHPALLFASSFALAGDGAVTVVPARGESTDSPDDAQIVEESQATKQASPEPLPPVKVERLIKSDEEERFVYGVVSEPDTKDTQGDVIRADTIRAAAHQYMVEHQNIGLQHEVYVNDAVKLAESFIAPVEFEIDGEVVLKGSWLMGVYVVDDAMWEAVKSGTLTGFSLGGFAAREALSEAS